MASTLIVRPSIAVTWQQGFSIAASAGGVKIETVKSERRGNIERSAMSPPRFAIRELQYCSQSIAGVTPLIRVLTSRDRPRAMPLIFSYGTLQQENVQRSMLGRRFNGQRDELLGFEQVVATTGHTHHANVKFNGNEDSRVPGMVFEITDAELASVDEYELAFFYKRVAAVLASGRRAWLYVNAQ